MSRLWIILLVCCLVSPALAATYVVNPLGTGDFPNIQAAINGCSAGDIVELTDGTFTDAGNHEIDFLGRAITLRSQSGHPELCRIDCQGTWGIRFHQGETATTVLQDIGLSNATGTFNHAVACSGTSPLIVGCVFDGNESALFVEGHGAPQVQDCVFRNGAWGVTGHENSMHLTNCRFTGITRRAADQSWPDQTLRLTSCTFDHNNTDLDLVSVSAGEIVISQCTFVHNTVPANRALLYCPYDPMTYQKIEVSNSILALTTGGRAARVGDPSSIDFSCSNLYGNEGGDWVGWIATQLGQDGNLSADPLFCGTDDFTLHLGSPCAPEANPSCGLIGAHPVACNDVYLFACCTSSGCDVLTIGDCTAAEGEWLVGITSCDPNPCSAACCVAEICQVTSHEECLLLGGDWLVGRLTCDFNPCDHVFEISADGSGEYPTIHDAVMAAENDYEIQLGDGVFTGAGNCDVSFQGKRITLLSASDDPSNCIIDCAGAAYGLRLQYGEPLGTRVEGISVLSAGSAAITCNGSPTLRNCVFSQSACGLECWGTLVRVENCTFADNAQAGVRAGGGACELEDCVFSANHGSGVSGDFESAFTFDRCVFMNNETTGNGGGFYGHSRNQAVFNDCTFYRNQAAGGGGAITMWIEGSCELRRCTLYGNEAPLGSGIYLANDVYASTLWNTIISGGIGGTAIEVGWSDTPWLTCCDLFGNEGGDWTGVIASQSSQNGNISLDPLLCNPMIPDLHLQEGSPCAPFSPPNASCDLIGAWIVGCEPAGVADTPTRARALRFEAAQPNPFAAETLLRFELPGTAEVRLRVFDTGGRLVRTLIDGPLAGGPTEVIWDGSDDQGAQVSGGVYFCRLEFGDQRTSRRVVLMR